MQPVFLAATTLTFAAALLLGGGDLAVAQGLPGGASTLSETHGDWQVTCVAPDGTARCAISQTQVQGESRQRVLAVELTATQGGNAAGGTLVLPFGLKLDDGVRLAIDEAAPGEPLRFSTCLPAGCLVPLAFDAATVTALRTGTALRITARANDSGQDVALSVSLAGFTSALARLAALSTSTE